MADLEDAPVLRRSETSFAADSMSAAIGFSTSRSMPFRSNGIPTVACSWVGTARLAAMIRP